MDTIVRPPAPPELEIEPASAHGPRRRRPVTAAAAAIVTLAVLIGGIWIANVEPLTQGSLAFRRAGIKFSTPHPSPGVRQDEIDSFGVYGTSLTIPAKVGTTFTYLFTIRNDGPLPIEIVDVGTDDMTITRTATGMDPDINDSPLVGYGIEPFAPFSLGPDGEATIQVEVLVGDGWCAQAGGTTYWWHERVTFRILGLERHMDADTGVEIRLQGTQTHC